MFFNSLVPMRLDKFVARSRIIDLESGDLKGALKELLGVSVGRFRDLNKTTLFNALMQREKSITTYLGNGVALPHIRIRMPRRYVFAVGRSVAGIQYDGLKDHEKIHLVFLLIANENERDYLKMLASIARLVKEKEFVDTLVAAPNLDALFERIYQGFGGALAQPANVQQNRVNRLIFREAEKVAKGAKCSSMVIFGDTLTSGLEIPKFFPEFETIMVTRTSSEPPLESQRIVTTIQVRSFSRHRLAQLRSAVLVGLTRGVINFTDRLCCVGGIPGSNQFDTIVVVDVEREFQLLFNDQAQILPHDVKPEVLERVLAVATELAVEGREGRPVGSLFILGDTAKVEKLTKPLVMNPFFGYKEEDRNIMNPFMDETIKEFSLLDGAFIIRGNGVVVSSGSLVHAPDYYHSLPGGLGARHAAASAISLATQCISVVVSSSTGQVTLFRNGVMVPLIEKSGSGGYY